MSESPARFLDAVSELLISAEASDLHVHVGQPPMIRVDGELHFVEGFDALTDDFVREVALFLLKKRLDSVDVDDFYDLDFSYVSKKGDRFRCNVFKSEGHFGVVMRRISSDIPSQQELGLPEALYEIADRHQGFFLVVGSAGMGKSTTLASLVDHTNRTHSRHIITIEDPIEYLFEPDLSIVSQREVGIDSDSFSGSLRVALRQDPDVILVGEMRDLDTIKSALTMAETGHLVMSTLHTNSASQAIDRIIDVFPADQQDQVRAQVASTLVGVFSQRLVPRKGGGRVLAYEMMLVNPAIRNLIRQGKVFQIDSFIDTSKQEGMNSLEFSLAELVNDGVVEYDDAMVFVRDDSKFERYLKKRT